MPLGLEYYLGVIEKEDAPEDDGEDGMEGVEKKDDEESAVCAAAG